MTLITNQNSKILYPKMSYIITGCCFETHNNLGCFQSERQYADELERIFKEKELKFQREFDLKNLSQEIPRGNRVDFLINNETDDIILLEIKAKKFITKEDFYQMLRYLKSSKIKLGLIVNFRNRYIKPKRIINI